MPNAKSADLTEQQRIALRAIARLKRETGNSPSMFEVSAAMGLSEYGAKTHIAALIKKGYVNRVPGQARSLRVLKMPAKPKETP